MNFPKFDFSFQLYDFSETYFAPFSTLYELHKLEVDKIIKFSYNLSLKALFPSNCQNVKLVLKVFNENISNSLNALGPSHNLPHYNGLSVFIKIITRWWSVMNVKTLFKGVRLNDNYQEPLTCSTEDVKLKFLHYFLDWLDAWNCIENNVGKLSKQTFTALKHTTHGIIELARYCTSELNRVYSSWKISD